MKVQLQKRLDEAIDRAKWAEELPDKNSAFKQAAKEKSQELLADALKDVGLNPEHLRNKSEEFIWSFDKAPYCFKSRGSGKLIKECNSENK